MAHFVKWSGPNLSGDALAIRKQTQTASVGNSFRFGIWGGAGLKVGPNDPSMASIATRDSVEGTTNNIQWYELVGRREGNVMIEARNSADNGVWDYFQLAVKKSQSKTRLPVRGINHNYHVDTLNIGSNWNASMVLNLLIAVVAVRRGTPTTDGNGNTYTAAGWSKAEFLAWRLKLKKLLETSWTEKFWLTTPASVTELEVSRPEGGRARVNLHCVLKVSFVPYEQAHHRIQVVKAGAANGLTFRSDSTHLDDMDLQDVAPAVSGFAKPFNTAIHELGHTLGLRHPFEKTTPSTPYCVVGHVDCNERMGLGDELRVKYATAWQNAAAAWFNSNGHGHNFKPADFPASMTRLSPVSL